MTQLVAIVPTCRPENWSRVLRMLRAQTRAPDAVVVVENGEAAGLTQGATVTLTSAPNVGAARQEGLAYVQGAYPGSLFAFFDDDDDYGPGYLRELYAARKRGEVLGKREVFYRFTASGAVVIACPGKESRPVDYIHGPTMAGWTDDAEPFLHCSGWGEDIDWQKRMVNKGARVYATSRYHFCGVRSETCDRHTWSLPDRVIGKAMCAAERVTNFGPQVMAGTEPAMTEPLDVSTLSINLPLPGAA